MAKNWLGDELDRNGWPVAVPILGPDDFCKGAFNKGGKCCLLGWSRAVTSRGPHGYGGKTWAVNDFIRRVIASEGHEDDSVSRFNDHIATARDRARVWNTAMRDLGYDVPASACK